MEQSVARSVAVIGDVHAEDGHLRKALEFLSESACTVLCVGDIVDGPGDVNRCCALLRESNAIVVRGNHERWLLEGSMRCLPDAHMASALSEENLQWLSALPRTVRLGTPAGAALLCHAIGEDDMTVLLPDASNFDLNGNVALERLLYESDYRFMLCGHTHVPMVRRFDNLTVVNAGTLKRTHSPCFATIDFEQGVVQFFDIVEGEITATQQILFP